MLERMPLGVLVHNERGVIVFANSQVARLVGVAERLALLGRMIGELFAPPFLKGLRDGLVAETGDALGVAARVREQLIRADGSMLEVELAAVPFLIGGEGQVQLMFQDLDRPEPNHARAWRMRPPTVALGQVLVVDDHELLRRVARRVLNRAGYTVIEAVDGPMALTMVEREPGLAAVLLDLGLPGLRGEAVLVRMMAMRPEIPVVVCSGQLLEEAHVAALLRLGRIEFLRKPFGVDELGAAFDRVLRLREAG